MVISIALTIIGLLLIILELIVGIETGFDLLLLGVALLIGGLTGYYSTDMIGIVISTLLLFGYLLVGRKFLKNKIKVFSHSSNTDSLIGTITNVKSWNAEKAVGIVSIDGEEWRAKTADDKTLNVNSKVKILNISGVTLIVAEEIET
ncbi:MAG: NfeD family protein [bacterium]|nr:NfeD family protein [bacterium]